MKDHLSTPTQFKDRIALKRILPLGIVLLLSLALVLPQAPALARVGQGNAFPQTIPLPNGFNPEGIVIGRGTTFYAGSLANGAIYRGDLRTGQGAIFIPGQPGRSAAGLTYDSRTNWLYVCGDGTGAAYIYDADTGAEVASFQFATGTTFVNDVIITKAGAYFTESFQPQLYFVPLLPNGQLPANPSFQVIPLTGDFIFVPGGFNANGIESSHDGTELIIVNSTTGALYTVDPQTGYANQIDLGGESVLNGDGILLLGQTLFVVQNANNQIAVVELSPDLTSGEVTGVLINPLFAFPTTIDRLGETLYAINSHLDQPITPDTEFQVIGVPVHQ